MTGAVDPHPPATVAPAGIAREGLVLSGGGRVADDLVAAMHAGGVRAIFFTSGSDIIALQEAVARREALNLPAPHLVTTLHETTALNAAVGFSAAGGGVGAVAVHVDAGLFNTGAGLNALRNCGEPVMLIVGSPPTTSLANGPAGRSHPVHWVQEPVDVRSTFRSYVKWDWRLGDRDNTGLVVSRGLQVARSEPAGAALLALPKELGLSSRRPQPYPTVDGLGLPAPTYPDPLTIERAADLLLFALSPVIVTGASGRDPATVELLATLAEETGAWITDADWRERLNVPSRHPLLNTGPPLSEADVVLVVERRAPWVPDSAEAPVPGAAVIWLGTDPVATDIGLLEHTATLRIPCTPRAGLDQLLCAVRARSTDASRSRARERVNRAVANRACRDEELSAAVASASGGPVDPRVVADAIGRALGDDGILLDDAVTNSGHLRDYYRAARAGSYFAQSGTTGGWGSGAALGVKLANPDRDVVLATGDGFYWFGVPGAAMWSARNIGVGYLSVVFVNRRFSTGTTEVSIHFPGGYAESAGFPGGVFDPPPDYAAEARAAGGWGAEISDAAEVDSAVHEGLARAREGQPAVVAVHVT